MAYTLEQLAAFTSGKILHQMPQSAPVEHLLIDSRKVVYPESSVFFAIKGERNDGHAYLPELYESGVRYFVVEHPTMGLIPADANVLLVSNALEALQKIAGCHRAQFALPVLGITGSNGKTIVKEWLAHLLKDALDIVKSPKSYNSQVGVPVSLWQIHERHDLGIFEAGISKKGEMQSLARMINPEMGILTYLGSAHNEGFHSQKEKLHEKLQLFRNSSSLLFCADQPEVVEGIMHFLPRHPQLNVCSWSKERNEANYRFGIEHGGNATRIISGKNVAISIPFTDEISVWNACTCLAFLLGLKQGGKLDDVQFENALSRFDDLPAVEMRMQLKEAINGCMLINDSYSSDLDSLQIALDFMNQQGSELPKVLILSDMLQSGLKADDLYVRLSQLIRQKGITRFIGIGQELQNHSVLFEPHHASFFKNTDDFLKHFDSLSFKEELILLKGARSFRFERISRLLEKRVHQTRFEINLNALQHNLNVYKSQLKPGVKLMAMVKAFSYGTGSYEIAKTLEFNRVDYLTVAYADEGVVLRRAGIKTPIMVMNPEPSSFEIMLRYNLEPEVYHFGILHELIKACDGQEAGIHVEVDSGMKRLGFDEPEIPVLISLLKEHSNLRIKSVFSHLASSEAEADDAFTREQIDKFDGLSTQIQQAFDYPVLKHCLNSAGIVRFPQGQFDMVRLGIGLYGIDPAMQLQNQLQHIGTLKTVISQIRNIEPGESIGYGRKGQVSQSSQIAIVAVGYADGINRKLSNGTGSMMVNGKPAPIIGNVCMDMTMLDVSGINCKEGDEVIVFGPEWSVEHIARQVGTIPYEILTSISQRVKRVYFYE